MNLGTLSFIYLFVKTAHRHTSVLSHTAIYLLGQPIQGVCLEQLLGGLPAKWPVTRDRESQLSPGSHWQGWRGGGGEVGAGVSQHSATVQTGIFLVTT